MNRNETLSLLAAHQNELREKFFVKTLSLFGSCVRNEATNASDIDLLVEFDRPVGLLHVIGTEQYLEHLLGTDVDLILRRALLPEFREHIFKEAVDAF